MSQLLDAYRASFETIARLQAEADELAGRITKMASEELPAAEREFETARNAHKEAAGASALGEAQDAAVRKARTSRLDAEEKREGLLSALETLRGRERELQAKQREAVSNQRQLAASIADPLLAANCAALHWIVPTLIATLRRIAQLTAITDGGFPTGAAFLRKTGDLANQFREARLLLQTDGIFPDFRDGRDALTPDELLRMAEERAAGFAEAAQ